MTGRFVLQVNRGGDLAASAYVFERTSFEREYGVGADDHDAEFAPYAEQSLLAAVSDDHGRVVGVMRMIHPGAAGEPVKTLVDAGLPPWSLDVARSVRAAGLDVAHTWDVASLAVDRTIGRARSIVLGALYHALVNLAEVNDIRFLLMTVDERVRTTLRMIGLPTYALPGASARPFEGSKASTPAWGHCADMLAAQRRDNPEAHQLLTRGVGLGEVALPGRATYLLDRFRAEPELDAAARPGALVAAR